MRSPAAAGSPLSIASAISRCWRRTDWWKRVPSEERLKQRNVVARVVFEIGVLMDVNVAGRQRPEMLQHPAASDIVGEDENAVAAAASQVVRIANARSGEGFIAVSSEARKKFWLDRARTAAI